MLRDSQLFGMLPAFRTLGSWERWIVFLGALYGLPLDAEQERIFCEHTGRSAYRPPEGGYPEAAAIVGVQSGKSRIVSTTAAFAAATATGEPDGTELFVPLIAQDERSAQRTLLGYVRAPFRRVPLLRSMVTSDRAGVLALSNAHTIATYPCRPEAVRGIRARMVIADELAFYRSSEGYDVSREMLRALRSRVATTGGKVMILSSPYAASGALFDLHKAHFGRDDSTTLVWVATSAQMNPTLRADYLARMERDDPEAFRSEFLGEFRAGLTALFDADALDDSVDAAVRERLPEAGVEYVAGADAATGAANGDRFAVSIAHRAGDRAVLDCCRAWSPPFDPAVVIGEAASLVKSYGVTSVEGDRASENFVISAFAAHGVTFRHAEGDTRSRYLEVLPRVNSGAIRLLDQPELLRELRALERRRGTAGRDRVDHPRGGHDDRAASVTVALLAASVALVPFQGHVLRLGRRDDARGSLDQSRSRTPVGGSPRSFTSSCRRDF